MLFSENHGQYRVSQKAESVSVSREKQLKFHKGFSSKVTDSRISAVLQESIITAFYFHLV